MSDQQATPSIELGIQMLSKLGELFPVMSPDMVDVSRIIHYEQKFNNTGHLKDQDFEAFGLETIRAMDLSADYAYIAQRFAKYAHVQYDKKSAEIYFTSAGKGLEEQKIKDSHSGREKFIDKDEGFTEAKNLRDAWQAFVDWLNQKRESFLQKHMWVKKQIDMRVQEKGGK